MSKLLFISASPRGEQSKSTALGEAYVEAFAGAEPSLKVDRLDLWRADLPAFDGDKTAAKMNVILGQQQDGPRQTAWDQIVAIAERFIAADAYVIAAPVWNGGAPYILKQYIDIIQQPGLLFGLDASTGYFGLLKDKRATLALTSGVYKPGAASEAFGADYQSNYLRYWLNQAGVAQVDEVRFQPTLLTATPEQDFEQAKQRAAALALAHARH